MQIAQEIERVERRHRHEIDVAQSLHHRMLDVGREEVARCRRLAMRCRELPSLVLGLDGHAFEELIRADDGRRRDAGELRDVNAVAAIGSSGHDAIDEDDVITPFADRHMEVRDAVRRLRKLRQFVIVGREEGATADRRHAFRDGPRETQSIQRARTATELIKDDEASIGRVMENVGRLGHLDHEGRVTRVQFVGRADSCEDPVRDAERRLVSGDD